jgi:hypothetical protein
MYMLAYLNGIILEKAENEENFSVFYLKVFERMEEIKGTEEDFLYLLGEIGG